ncbi:MAG: formylglycine-generating enzyme family protein [Pirellula sp.]|nr:formylglycine-generating enzyme family protein [Pirellula sp.]
MRLEGEWLRDSKGAPRTIAASLEELIARSLRYEDATVDDSLIASAVSAAMNDGRVLIIVDAFDQMTEEDRKHVASLLKGDAHEQIDRDDAALCGWLITGRPYALRKYQPEIEELGANRLRLVGLSRQQQDRYFQDYEVDPYFQQRQTKPLDWVCVARKDIDEDLAIPFHLREIRRLIEEDIGRAEGVRRISSTGELHGMVARALLQRAVKHYANEAVPPNARRPDDKHEQLDLLLRVCGLLAFQMMLEEKYNASVDNHEDVSAVRSFLERARARFLSGERSSGAESAVESTRESWRWAEWMLEKIEFSHRGDIDSFSHQCRSFRDRKTMEWYAALYLMKYATTDELRQKIAGAGDRCAADFAFDREWLSNCWRQAIDMPRDLVKGRVAIQSLGVLFQRPDPNRTDQARPCELMWRAWERWLEPPNRTRDAQSALSKPLPGADDLIAKFREEFRTLCAANDELALSLQFAAARDRPDTKLGNKTQDGQYRLIPPNAASTTFQGERPSPVIISAFWLRKFVVTNAEYRLFDLHFESVNKVGDFDQPDRPVVGVDWYAAVMFCRWLGAAYCLPTEAQWEAACRANETAAQETEFWFGGESQLANHAWWSKNAEGRTHSLAESVQARGHENPWGLYDMHGNVWEWCQDWYGEYSQAAGQNNPQGAENGSDRVSRGGSWNASVGFCRSASRNGGYPSYRYSRLGFRIALSSSGPVRVSGASSEGPVGREAQPRPERP